jgi:beta-RFAP synthase
MTGATLPAAVRVRAPARLHLGFLDLEGGLGRRFGSLGLAIEEIATVVSLRAAAADRLDGAEAARVARHLATLRAAWGIDVPVAVTVEPAIPAHAGLGSGTQLGLALGLGLARLVGRKATPADVAVLLDRGARSGIGVGAFAAGGFLVDGGRAAGEALPPPIVARLPFPAPWRLVLIQDPARQGAHGPDEAAAFRALPPFPAERAAHLCRLTLLRLLPAIARADIATAGNALSEIQGIVGDHFAPVQGGRFTSPVVAAALAWAARAGAAGIGQSSWGPTGWALVASAPEAERLATAGAARFATDGLVFRPVAGRNRPGEVTEILHATSS